MKKLRGGEFIKNGEGLAGLESVYPLRLAGDILRVGLAEKAECEKTESDGARLNHLCDCRR